MQKLFALIFSLFLFLSLSPLTHADDIHELRQAEVNAKADAKRAKAKMEHWESEVKDAVDRAKNLRDLEYKFAKQELDRLQNAHSQALQRGATPAEINHWYRLSEQSAARLAAIVARIDAEIENGQRAKNNYNNYKREYNRLSERVRQIQRQIEIARGKLKEPPPSSDKPRPVTKPIPKEDNTPVVKDSVTDNTILFWNDSDEEITIVLMYYINEDDTVEKQWKFSPGQRLYLATGGSRIAAAKGTIWFGGKDSYDSQLVDKASRNTLIPWRGDTINLLRVKPNKDPQGRYQVRWNGENPSALFHYSSGKVVWRSPIKEDEVVSEGKSAENSKPDSTPSKPVVSKPSTPSSGDDPSTGEDGNVLVWNDSDEKIIVALRYLNLKEEQASDDWELAPGQKKFLSISGSRIVAKNGSFAIGGKGEKLGSLVWITDKNDMVHSPYPENWMYWARKINVSKGSNGVYQIKWDGKAEAFKSFR